jgi:hypothetical protein
MNIASFLADQNGHFNFMVDLVRYFWKNNLSAIMDDGAGGLEEKHRRCGDFKFHFLGMLGVILSEANYFANCIEFIRAAKNNRLHVHALFFL